MQNDEIHVQIWNDKGEKVVDEICKAQTATQDQSDGT